MNSREDDEKELEEWYAEEQRKKIEQYGINIENVKAYSNKDNKVIKGIAKFWKILTIIVVIIISIVWVIGFILGIHIIDNTKQKFDADVKNVEKMYGIKTVEVSKDVDKNGNGIYVLCLKNNKDIKFHVYKHFGELKDDYSASSHKYYFDKWNDNDKNRFEIEEEYDDKGLLYYKMSVKLESADELENVLNIIYRFVEFGMDCFSYQWKIYFYTDNFTGEFFSEIPSNYKHSEEVKQQTIKRLLEMYLPKLTEEESL